MKTLRTISNIPLSAVLTGMAVIAIISLAGCSCPKTAVQTTTLKGYDHVPQADDFIQQWVILEPISVNGLTMSATRANVEKEYFPNQLTVVPNDGDKVTIDGAEYVWHAVDFDEYNYNLYYFSADYGKPSSNVLYWVVTVVDCPVEMRDVRLAIGSNAASVWWVNGEEVIGIYNDRQTTIDDGVSPLLTLKKGRNIIRGAVINGGGATDFCGRLIDANEMPLTGYTVSIGK